MAIQLPTEPAKPVRSIQSLVWLLYGARKIGKTSLAAQIPNNILLCSEWGARGVQAIRVEFETWEEFLQIADAYLRSDLYRCATIDTVDALWEMCVQYVCRREGVRQPGDRPYGEVWSLVEKEWTRALRTLHRTRGLILISHSDTSELAVVGRDRKTRIEPSIPKTARRYILAVSDLITYYGYEGDKRVLVLAGNESIEAGMRYPIFTENDGRPLTRIEMGNSAEESYRILTSYLHLETPLTGERERSIRRIRAANATTT